MSARRDEIERTIGYASQAAADVLRRERRAAVYTRLAANAFAHAWIAAVGVALMIASGGAGALWDAGRIALALAVTAALLVLANALSATRDVDERDALARWDDELGLEDRLQTAHEYLRTAHRSGFMEAAIEDAHPVLGRVRAATLAPRPAPAPIWTQTARNGLALALTVILCGLLLRPLVAPGSPVAGAQTDVARGAAIPATAPQGDAPVTTEPGGAEAPPAPDETKTPGGREASESEAAGEIPDSSRDTRGATGEGRSAEASASQGAGQSKGVPSAQGQVSVPPDKKPRKPKKRKRKAGPEAEQAEARKKAEEQKSGSTAGSGAASGSNRNPSTSDWSSKDQVSETDDDPVEDDADVDDDEEESENRGGMQPNLRDRRPPVNRDLSVGFGNQPDEEANGRGGPGQQKKSRGTASLVLGVPIPDHIKGQPNPGRTKITQERVEPKEDDATVVPAADRGTRDGPAGHQPRPLMSPWLRAVVRAYFLQQAAEKRETP